MNTMQSALAKVGMKRPPVSPSNPSRRAIERVKNPLPIPTTCPHCSGPVALVNNSAIYGRTYGEWPWAYRCESDECDSYVGLHPFTDIPLGTLADFDTRESRKHAKSLFNPIWESCGMTRTEAYEWLANELGISDVKECHIGWFDVATCSRVIEICERSSAEKLLKAKP